jgi:hypothetical protein
VSRTTNGHCAGFQQKFCRNKVTKVPCLQGACCPAWTNLQGQEEEKFRWDIGMKKLKQGDGRGGQRRRLHGEMFEKSHLREEKRAESRLRAAMWVE